MCGILAILGIANGAETMRQRALTLSKMIRHRGPDWSGIYCMGNNILCHERLAIVGVDDGAQPLYNKTKTIAMSVNGEIYNHLELRKTLQQKGHTFMTNSDCEVLLCGVCVCVCVWRAGGNGSALLHTSTLLHSAPLLVTCLGLLCSS